MRCTTAPPTPSHDSGPGPGPGPGPTDNIPLAPYGDIDKPLSIFGANRQ